MQHPHETTDKDILRRLHELRRVIQTALYRTGDPDRSNLYDLLDMGLNVCEGIAHGEISAEVAENFIDELQDLLNNSIVQLDISPGTALRVSAA